MRRLMENMVIRFSAVSLIAFVVIGTAISLAVSAQLGAHADVIRDNLPLGQLRLGEDIDGLYRSLFLATVGIAGGGFVALYCCLVGIVWGGWKTIGPTRGGR